MNTRIIQVLLVEDNATDALVVQDDLENAMGAKFAVTHVEQVKEAIACLATQPFDVVLLDLSLPDSHGFETFTRLHAAAPDIPILVLSGRSDEELAVKAVKAGAQDYMVKGRLGEDVLPRSIRYAIERQRTERTLAESEERYRLLIERSPDSYLVECGGQIVFANAASLKLFGADQMDQLLGRSVLESVSPEFQPAVHACMQTALGNGVNRPIELLGIRLDGTVIAVESSSTSFLHEGRPAVQIVLRDITARRQSEERVREQAAMLDHAHEAIIVRDIRTGLITFWNRGAERMYGWTAAEAEGRNIGELIFPDPKVSEMVTDELLRSDEWHGEYRQVTHGTKELMVSAHVTLVRDSSGAPKSALVINIDITEQKALELRFLRAQRMESIGTLAGGIAHDLNNVLAPIMMSIDLLKMEERNPSRINILNTIETSAQRGADMVKQVLSFARGVEGKQLEVQVGHLLKEIKKIAEDTFLKSIRLRSSIPAELWTVQGDPTQLHQVVLNLCVNARDAMPEGGTLKLSASNVVLGEDDIDINPGATPGPHVVIQVEDSGTGMPPEVIERIYEPFFTTKELGKGTGLGLSTTAGIIKSHKGFILVQSEMGVGTKFRVYIPASTVHAPADEVLPKKNLPHGRGECVLVIDDEDAVRQITRQTLEAFGYSVLLAADGAIGSALYAANKQKIAVVLVDMMMPVMDGPETVHTLLRMNHHVRIIAASGLNANGVAAKAAQAGVKHFLPKPYTADTLLIALRQVLEAEFETEVVRLK